ncbi:uncharacterized protein TRAVEDRAFT_52696 [Trametes versicolor FP-101664 SS1]|uniref:uncharacterized protein n=1 Tax=Trametes versicolor (strain FP-101664) TaxID=717944 RepID=UPI000462168C|nr:uncharacterized protein TRAVEDRAFT_52696 [Trametes versicolor FP-101664 SS1]EIW53575.1 hypothetical protein TRAVEDRAFT_52696 [Trametes versicolor FP-101664 SS1]
MLDDDAIRVSRSGPSWRTIFRHVPEVALAYALHVGVRGVRPRRLPAFTSMKLREIYTGLGLASIAEAAATDYMSQVASDDDLSACDVAAYAWTSRKVNMAVGGISDDNISWLRAWRLGNYDNRDLLGKLAWWHNHIWSDETTWVWAAALWFTYFYDEENPEIRNDHNIYITHLANVRGAHLSRTLSPVSMASLLGFRQYVHIPLLALAASAPLAIFARRTGRLLLYLPINALQRLLFGATLYCGTMQRHQHAGQLTALKEKHAMAAAVKAALVRLKQTQPMPGC